MRDTENLAAVSWTYIMQIIPVRFCSKKKRGALSAKNKESKKNMYIKFP